jgi:hypothetical protein
MTVANGAVWAFTRKRTRLTALSFVKQESSRLIRPFDLANQLSPKCWRARSSFLFPHYWVPIQINPWWRKAAHNVILASDAPAWLSS